METHRLNWDEGQEGKGILDTQGNLHTWDSEEYEVHHDYLYAHPEIQPDLYLYIEPDGRTWSTSEMTEENAREIQDADPRLHIREDDLNPYGAWGF